MGLKHVSSLLAAQLPREIQTRIKAEDIDINDNLEHADDHKLIATVKSEMTEEGYALNKGNRNFEAVTKVAVIHPIDDEGDFSTETPPTVAYVRGQSSFKRRGQNPRSKRVEGCYICGGRHSWRFCPDKRSPACGEKDHILKDCSVKRPSGEDRKIWRIGHTGSTDSLAVVLPMIINGEIVQELLDSGASPSVIDIETVRNLGLETQMTIEMSEIYGLSQEPVKVAETLNLTLDLWHGQIVEQTFEVLLGAQNTCILGRDLLSKFGTV